MLGYFVEPDHDELQQFLTAQREDRRRRVVEMAARLARLGVPIDLGGLLDAERLTPGQALGRPLLARALVAQRHARDVPDAFDRFLAAGRPAYVERTGAPPRDVAALIERAGGVASLAHPVKLPNDERVIAVIQDGVGAIEVYHPDHEPADVARFRELARRFDLLVTGGSDYHGPGSGRSAALGRVSLPAADFERLRARRSSSRR